MGIKGVNNFFSTLFFLESAEPSFNLRFISFSACTLTELAELSGVSAAALTLARHAGAVVAAVGHLALGVADGALGALRTNQR